jgi:hypothetical protein
MLAKKAFIHVKAFFSYIWPYVQSIFCHFIT